MHPITPAAADDRSPAPEQPGTSAVDWLAVAAHGHDKARPAAPGSVRCRQAGPQLQVELLEHRVIDGTVRAEEKERLTLLCASKGLAHHLCRALDGLHLQQVQGLVAVLLRLMAHQPLHAACGQGAGARLAIDDAALAQADAAGHLPAVAVPHQGVQGHEDHAAFWRQQAAQDLHPFLPLVVTEGQRLHGLPDEIVILPSGGRA